MSRMILLEPTDGDGNMHDATTIAVFGVLFGNAPYVTGFTFDRMEILGYHIALVVIAFLSYRRGKNRNK